MHSERLRHWPEKIDPTHHEVTQAALRHGQRPCTSPGEGPSPGTMKPKPRLPSEEILHRRWRATPLSAQVPQRTRRPRYGRPEGGIRRGPGAPQRGRPHHTASAVGGPSGRPATVSTAGDRPVPVEDAAQDRVSADEPAMYGSRDAATRRADEKVLGRADPAAAISPTFIALLHDQSVPVCGRSRSMPLANPFRAGTGKRRRHQHDCREAGCAGCESRQPQWGRRSPLLQEEVTETDGARASRVPLRAVMADPAEQPRGSEGWFEHEAGRCGGGGLEHDAQVAPTGEPGGGEHRVFW